MTVLQNLGRLLLRYHFSEEAEQIHQLRQPVPAVRIDGEIISPPQPGLDEESAAYAVLGVDVESLGNAAARQWGLGQEILHMIRRVPVDAPVRKPDNDNELLRIVASAANEAVEALAFPAPKAAAALNEVVVRYARTLRLTTRVLDDALDDAKAALANDGKSASERPADDSDDGVDVRELARPRGPGGDRRSGDARSRAARLSWRRPPSRARTRAPGRWVRSRDERSRAILGRGTKRSRRRESAWRRCVVVRHHSRHRACGRESVRRGMRTASREVNGGSVPR